MRCLWDGGVRQDRQTGLGKPSKEKTGNILVFYQSGVPPPRGLVISGFFLGPFFPFFETLKLWLTCHETNSVWYSMPDNGQQGCPL